MAQPRGATGVERLAGASERRARVQRVRAITGVDNAFFRFVTMVRLTTDMAISPPRPTDSENLGYFQVTFIAILKILVSPTITRPM